MTGLSISCYQARLQAILEKKAGSIHMDNLQAILLMEGGFNGAMKILVGARMICSALEMGLIPDECYGNQPGCTTIQVSLNCTLMANVTWQSQAVLAVASVDCLTCYDSIGHPLASIACQHLGLSASVLETIFGSILNMHISENCTWQLNFILWQVNHIQSPISGCLPGQQFRSCSMVGH